MNSDRAVMRHLSYNSPFLIQHPWVFAILSVLFAFFIYQFVSAAPLRGPTEALTALAFELPIQYVLFVVIRRLQFNQLSKYPGPWWAAMTDWYTVIHLLKGDRHMDFHTMHKKYGKFVRYGPNRLSVKSVQALHEIYGPKSNTTKSKVYDSQRQFFGNANTLTEINRNEHDRRRNSTIAALGPQLVKNVEATIVRYIEDFASTLVDGGRLRHQGGWSKSKNIAQAIGAVISATMGDISLSAKLSVRHHPNETNILEDNVNSKLGNYLIGHMPELFYLNMHKFLFKPLVDCIQRHHSLVSGLVRERAGKGVDASKDLYSMLGATVNSHTEHSISDSELHSEAGLLFTVGTNATAETICGTIFYVLHNPASYARVQTELRKTYARCSDIAIGKKLESCRYLLAAVEETLRMNPPFGNVLPREILHGGLIVDNEVIPGGVDIGVPLYAMHHDPACFRDPFTFRPERWLGTGEGGFSEADLARAQRAFAAFGVGQTSCTGSHLARQLVTLTLARLFWEFDMRMEPSGNLGDDEQESSVSRNGEYEYQLTDRFVSNIEGPMVQFRRR